MTHDHTEALWRDFPATWQEFEVRFPNEVACREYLIDCRWDGKPCCARCGNANVWSLRDGTLFECTDQSCRHQTSITSGTLFHGTRKPLRVWFQVIFELCVHRHGVSSADIKRIFDFGSYSTAWHWTHKIKRAMRRENPDKLKGCAQTDEALIGGKGNEKKIVVIAAEEGGRVRMIHAPGNHAKALKVVVDSEIDEETTVKTDGHAGYNKTALGGRKRDAKVQSKAEKRENDHLQLMHWMASNVKRWLLGTHHGGVQPKHLQSYLDEFSFRHNRRKTNGVARIVARCLENIVAHEPLTKRQLIDDTYECRYFQGASY